MKEDNVIKLMDLAEELYVDAQKNSGMVSPIPYAFVEGEGKLLIISNHGKDSKELKEVLNKYYGRSIPSS